MKKFLIILFLIALCYVGYHAFFIAFKLAIAVLGASLMFVGGIVGYFIGKYTKK